jgi:hypothetical protein
MEVHAHTRTTPASGGTGKKKWTHYLWEFLMLFLAVFCGFLAEYMLEHKIENDREKQFIESLAADLKDDIGKIDEHIIREQKNIILLDSLCHYLDTPSLARKNSDVIYYTARVGPRSAPFVNNSRTFDQLKNSGGFRLIHKTETSNRIMDYYSQFPWLRLLEGNYNREFDSYKEAAAKVIDPGIYRRQENPDGTINRSMDNPPLLSYNAALLKEMEFHAVQMNGSRRSLMPLIQNLKKSAEDLLKYLQQNYHLK